MKIFIKNLSKFLKEEYKHRKTDAYIVSFPKCGRTWLRVLIGYVLKEKFNLPEQLIINTFEMTSKSGILRTRFSHDNSSIIEGYSYKELPTDKSRYKDKKVVFLVRNIKDVLVSCYFQATKRVRFFEGNISDFIRSEKHGIMKIIKFYQIWHENVNTPKDFLLVSYEDLDQKPELVLSSTMNFLGLKDLDLNTEKKAIEFAKFNKMKKMEKSDFFRSYSMRPGNSDDVESFKVRRGLVGGYNSYLSKEDIEYIDQIIEINECPFAK